MASIAVGGWHPTDNQIIDDVDIAYIPESGCHVHNMCTVQRRIHPVCTMYVSTMLCTADALEAKIPT